MRTVARILTLVFAVLIALPLCSACWTAKDMHSVAQMAMGRPTPNCCNDAPVDPASGENEPPLRCVHCTPAAAPVAVESAAPPLPILAFEPILYAQPLELIRSVPVRTQQIESLPPPDTLVALHTMLTT